MPNIFDENYKIYVEGVELNLSRKIFGEPVKCCLAAVKKNEKCPNFDTEDHKYNRAVDNALDEVRDVCEMLNMGPVFINSYTKTTLWTKYFNQSSYMKYHIENWYINIIRLEDMFLILINEMRLNLINCAVEVAGWVSPYRPIHFRSFALDLLVD